MQEAEVARPAQASYALQRIIGFMRIRHFGFLANRCRRRCLAQIRIALAAPPARSANDGSGDTRHLALSALRAGAPARRLPSAATPGRARPGPARRSLMCTTERPIDSASSMQRAAPTCARGSAPALAEMPEQPHTSGPGGPHQPPMTPAADPKTRDPASRRRQPLVVHALVHTPARTTIPSIEQRTTGHTPAPDSGLGQSTDS